MNVLREYVCAIEDDQRPILAACLQLALPIAFGAIALIPDGTKAFESQIVTVVAIVAGLLFSMLVLLIELRGRVRRGEDRRATPGDRDSLNLDYAYYATNYTIITGFALAGLLLLQENLYDLMPPWLMVASNWLLYAMAAHFAVAAVHCLKRLRRCYEVFGKGNS